MKILKPRLRSSAGGRRVWALGTETAPNASISPTLGAEDVPGNVAAYRETQANGRGAVGVNGVLIGAAHVKMAEQTLARAALINGAS